MKACPTCGKPVDPVRAPAVRIVGGRVVGFCSAACADLGAAAALVALEPPGAAPSMLGPAVRSSDDPAAAAPRHAVTLPERSKRPSRTDRPAWIDRPATGRRPAVDEHGVAVASAPASPRPAVDAPPAAAAAATLRSATPPGTRRRRIIALVAAVVVGGMAIAILQAVSPSTPTRVDAAVTDDRAREPAAALPVAPPAPDPGAARAAAEAELRTLLTGTPRVRRVAAMALARGGDAAAIAALADDLAGEDNDIARLEVAYALGRAGDARGKADLVKAMKSSRHDVRADAARLLAQLGDPAGTVTLRKFLDQTQYHLGAAEGLARLRNPDGVAALRAVVADPAAGRENQLRALVALGRAGVVDVAPALREVLADNRVNVGAAAALADLGDPAARDVLIGQLGVPSLRVGAAVSLRRLEPGLDAGLLIAPLSMAMTADKDIERAGAAEALLILTGPPAVARFD